MGDLGDGMHLGALHHHPEYPHAMQSPYADLHHQSLSQADYTAWLLNSSVPLADSCGVTGLGKLDHDMHPYDIPHHHHPQPLPDEHLQQPMKVKKTPKNKCVSKEIVREKDGTLIYSYTYLMKNSNGEEHLQKINIKKKNGKAKEKDTKETKGSKKSKKEKAKEPKKTKKTQKMAKAEMNKTIDIKGMKNHEILRLYIVEHIVKIKSYTKFIVSRVLQDFKRDYPTVKISYGTVKKILDEKGLLPEK